MVRLAEGPLERCGLQRSPGRNAARAWVRVPGRTEHRCEAPAHLAGSLIHPLDPLDVLGRSRAVLRGLLRQAVGHGIHGPVQGVLAALARLALRKVGLDFVQKQLGPAVRHGRLELHPEVPVGPPPPRASLAPPALDILAVHHVVQVPPRPPMREHKLKERT